MKKIKVSKRSLILIGIFILVIIIIIMIVNYYKNLPPKSIGSDIDKSEEIFDTDFRELENIDLYFSVYDTFYNVIDIINSSDNEKNEKVLELLDEDYIDYYNLNKNNVIDKVKEYMDKKFIIKNILSARTSGNFTSYLITAINDEVDCNFIVRVDFSTLSYSIILPNFINDYGYENFVTNNLKVEKSIKSNNNNKFNYLVLTNEEILEKYSNVLNYFEFEYVYENFIGENTKNNYSKEEIEDLFNNENSYFNRAAFVDLVVTNSSDYDETTYEFKDRKMNEYKITESGNLNLKIDFIIVPEEEIVNEDGGGLLEIIQQ